MHAGCGKCFARNFVVCRFSQEAGRVPVADRSPAYRGPGKAAACCECSGGFSLNVANFFIHLQPDKRDDARFPLIRSI